MQAVIARYEDGVVGVPADGKFIPITNSETARLTCLRRWWYSNVEGLRRPMEGDPIDRGSSWDAITEDMYRWWEVTDQPYPEGNLDTCGWCHARGTDSGGDPCPHCRGTGDGVMVRAMQPWHDALEQAVPPFGPEVVEQEEERLRRAFRGYVERYQARPLQHFRIVGVQSQIARPVINPVTGKPYRPATHLIRTEDGWVRAGTAAMEIAKATGAEVKRVAWPVYWIGALDAVARDRSNGQGWVIDAKYTGAMRSFEARLQVDPQLPLYCWLLDAHREHFGLTGVAGMMYDLTSSRMHGDPYELKWKPPLIGEMKAQAQDRGLETKGVKGAEAFMALLGIEPGHGGFSTAESKLGSVPSWRLREAVEHAGLDPEPYEEAIDWCEREVDPHLYGRPYRLFSQDDRDRAALESYSKAKMTSALHRAAVRVASPDDIAIAYPRTPVCALPGGSCPYVGPCHHESPEAREQFDQRRLVVWRDEATPEDNTPSPHEEFGF